jgi:hypothetical protein
MCVISEIILRNSLGDILRTPLTPSAAHNASSFRVGLAARALDFSYGFSM